MQLRSALGKAKDNFNNTRELSKVLQTYGARIAQLTTCLKDCRELLSPPTGSEFDPDILREIDDVIANREIKKGKYATHSPPANPAADAQAEVNRGPDTGGSESAPANLNDPPAVSGENPQG